MRNDCLERRLRELFFQYGNKVAKYPYLFIIIPVVFAGIMCVGFVFMTQENNIVYLYTPRESIAVSDQSRLKKRYPEFKGFSASRSLNLDLAAEVIITHKENSSIWDEISLQEILELDNLIQNIGANVTDYNTVCERALSGECYGNEGLVLIRTSTDLSALQYPVHYNSTGVGRPARRVFMGFMLGGVTTDNSGFITDVLAMHLTYYLKQLPESHPWLIEFAKEMKKVNFRHIHVDFVHSFSIQEELVKDTQGVIPYYSISFALLALFSILVSMLYDPVRSKHELGLCGVISAGLSIVSALGAVMLCGLPFTDIVAAAPFLALGIGVDDAFVMIAAWRKSDNYLDMAERLPEALSEAAMSITITSVTDVVAVGIGIFTPFPSVRIFSIYTCVMLFMEYIFQITFFAGCMALSGKREEENRHGWTCMKVLPKSQADNESDAYMTWCAGGVSKTDRNDEVDNTEVMLMKWFRDTFSTFITHPLGKTFILILSAAYLGAAIWGVTIVNRGIELEKFAPENSDPANFYAVKDRYFTEYMYDVQIILHASLNHKDSVDEVKKLIEELEKSPYFRGPQLTVSWLRDYERYAEANNWVIDYENLFDSRFDQFLQEDVYAEYAMDVLLKEKTFRFILMASPSSTTSEELSQMKNGRQLAYQFKDLKVVVFSNQYFLTEQYVEIFTNTLASLEIAICSMLFVSLLLIPSPVVALWISLSIASILFGIVGYMALWNIRLDPVSLVNIIVCVGFSVDYTAHITYAFVTSPKCGRNERVEDALYTIGMPILQGSASTLIAIAALASTVTYLFHAFIKIIFLAIIISMMHGLCILPVLLSLIGPTGMDDCKVDSKIDLVF